MTKVCRVRYRQIGGRAEAKTSQITRHPFCKQLRIPVSWMSFCIIVCVLPSIEITSIDPPHTWVMQKEDKM